MIGLKIICSPILSSDKKRLVFLFFFLFVEFWSEVHLRRLCTGWGEGGGQDLIAIITKEKAKFPGLIFLAKPKYNVFFSVFICSL